MHPRGLNRYLVFEFEETDRDDRSRLKNYDPESIPRDRTDDESPEGPRAIVDSVGVDSSARSGEKGRWDIGTDFVVPGSVKSYESVAPRLVKGVSVCERDGDTRGRDRLPSGRKRSPEGDLRECSEEVEDRKRSFPGIYQSEGLRPRRIRRRRFRGRDLVEKLIEKSVEKRLVQKKTLSRQEIQLSGI